MNEKFNKNAKVEKFTHMQGIAVRLIVIDPLCARVQIKYKRNILKWLQNDFYWRLEFPVTDTIVNYSIL